MKTGYWFSGSALALGASFIGACAVTTDDGGATDRRGAATAATSPAAGATKTVRRLPNGVLEVRRGEAVEYLRPNCDHADTTRPACQSYVPSTPDGEPMPMSGAPSLSCSGGTGVCFGAADLEAVYQVSIVVPSNATIAIIGNADTPNLESDLAVYRSTYGLPPCTSASGCFQKVNGSGKASPLPAFDKGWATEQTLDVDMASAGCPTCKILVVEADPSSFLFSNAAATAVRLGATVVSYSGGMPEFYEEGLYDAQLSGLGVGLFASTGDQGGADSQGEVLWPAVSSAVTAVGGTDLAPYANSKFPDGTTRGYNEMAWVQTDGSPWGGAGWGCSRYEPKPSWQTDSGCDNRMVADVAAIAGTGVWTFLTVPGTTGGWTTNFGTSVASPLVAAIYAQTGASKAGPSLSYRHDGTTRFIDIIQNVAGLGTCPSSDPLYFCNAATGYDGPTGNGVPLGNALGGVWQPTLSVRPTGEVDVVSMGADNSLLYKSAAPDGDWLTAVIAGYGTTFSMPAIAVRANGEVDVVAQGAGESLMYYANYDGSWHSHPIAGAGTTFSAPAIAIHADGEADVVAQGPGNSLRYYTAMPGGSWSETQVGPGSTVFSAPVIAVRPTDEVDVAFQAAQNSLAYDFVMPGVGWSGAIVDGAGTTYSAPSLVVRPTGEADIAALGPSQSLLYHWAAPGTPWFHATVAGAGTTLSAPSLFVGSSGEAEIVAQGTVDPLYIDTAVPGGPWVRGLIAGAGTALSPPTMFVRPSGEVDVVVTGPDASLEYYWNTGNGWWSSGI